MAGEQGSRLGLTSPVGLKVFSHLHPFVHYIPSCIRVEMYRQTTPYMDDTFQLSQPETSLTPVLSFPVQELTDSELFLGFCECVCSISHTVLSHQSCKVINHSITNLRYISLKMGILQSYIEGFMRQPFPANRDGNDNLSTE